MARIAFKSPTDVVDRRLHEEHEAKTVLKELEKLDVDCDEFTRQLTQLRDAVLDHAQRGVRRVHETGPAIEQP